MGADLLGQSQLATGELEHQLGGEVEPHQAIAPLAVDGDLDVGAGHQRTDVPMLLKGAYSRRDEGGDNPAYIVESATKLAEMRTNGQVTVAIDLSKGAYSGDVMSDVRAIAETFPGSAPLEFRWSDGTGSNARLRSRSLTLAADGATLSALRNILGESSVKLQRGS